MSHLGYAQIREDPSIRTSLGELSENALYPGYGSAAS
jgi:hypothetical protein